MNERSLVISLRAEDDYRVGEPVVLTVEVENRGSDPLRLLGWGTPFEERFSSSFLTVERDGEVLPYDGRLVKRGDPGPRDYLTIEPGATVETRVDVSAGYPIEGPGKYMVRVKTQASDAFVVTAGESEEARPRDRHERLALDSPAVTFTVLPGEQPRLTEGAQARAAERDAREKRAADAEEGASAGEAGGGPEPIMEGGTGEQQQEVLTAHQNAHTIAGLAASRLVENEADALYQEWFGEYDQERYETVARHYEQIESTLGATQVTYNLTGEGCEPGVFAYTYQGSTTVWLCERFWEAPASGSDSQFGTLIHEWSHAVCATEDHVYGEEAAKALAESSPEEAITNADNHEYFAEHL
jgi:hypothetical protein